jgi:phage replication-related protein YjqB (UPF0714/DUF867 family)
MADKYKSYKDLSTHERLGRDFRIISLVRPGATNVIVAPHGGRIERFTAEIAGAIAGDKYSLYAFVGTKGAANRDLHITSHLFDEPSAIRMVRSHRRVVAVHGCKSHLSTVLLGGLDHEMISVLAATFSKAGIPCKASGHPFLGRNRHNICNRGSSNVGVQLELPLVMRQTTHRDVIVDCVREALARVA